MIAEGSTVLFWVVYLLWISRNCTWFIWTIVAINVFAFIGTIFVYESPRYLFGMEKYDEARNILTKYAKINGIKNYRPITFIEE